MCLFEEDAGSLSAGSTDMPASSWTHLNPKRADKSIFQGCGSVPRLSTMLRRGPLSSDVQVEASAVGKQARFDDAAPAVPRVGVGVVEGQAGGQDRGGTQVPRPSRGRSVSRCRAPR